MNNQTILYAVVALFVGFVAWDKLIPRLKPFFTKKSASIQAMIDLAAAINELPKSISDSIIEMSTGETMARAQTTADLISAIDSLSKILLSDESTKMLAGTLKACEAIAAATVELRDEVAAFGKLVHVDDKQYPPEQITQPDQSKDEHVMSFLQTMAQGRSFQEATQQAADDAEKKMMFSAVTLDPTGGE